MISMSGYAYREKSSLSESGQDLSVSVEIKGCNSRFLEIFVNLPPWLSTLEMKFRDLIAANFGRGKIEVFIRIREHNTPVTISVNKNAAKAYYGAINDLSKDLNLDNQCSIDTLLSMEGVLEIEKNRDEERYLKEIEPLLKEAIQIFAAEREREGEHTEKDIMANLEIIISSVKTVSSYAPVIEKTLKENIKNRFAELLGNQIDENRILAETASLLLKYTISEEISRLSSHLEEFKAEAKRNKTPGKKLDFLCQEINREINTIGSKSAIVEVSGEVVKMKEALENIREQLRNIE
jgi:uncharacterized protein (TIGR00255 family)